MNYRETIDFLYTQLPMFTRVGEKAYKNNLDNILALSSILKDPHKKFRSIHIAGTNGKGSTSHMLAAVLQKAGYKTGLFTSPHLFDFRERIRVNGEMISEEAVVNFMERTTPLSISPSFFEFTAAMAFDHFANEQVDIALIETGLGGRLDSTNIISPELSVITNIGYDHMYLLGDTLEKIAYEKAGIIKQNTPVLIGEVLNETGKVFTDKAATMNATIRFAEDTWQIDNILEQGLSSDYSLTNKANHTKLSLRTDLTGHYQAKNICTVLTAIGELRSLGFSIPESAVAEGLSQVQAITGLKGRWEILDENPRIIADVAHNRDGISQILKQLSTSYENASLHFILGFVKDKEIESLLNLFPSSANYYFTNAQIPRALPHNELLQAARAAGLNGESFENVNEALAAARGKAKKEDVIMICGSFFILAELKF